MRLTIVLLVCLMLTACATYRTALPSTLSVGVQQDIKSVKSSESIQYTFIGHPEAEKVVYQWSLVEGGSFNINRSVNGLFEEWAETKFGSISENSANTVSISISSIESICNNMGMSVSGSLMIEVTFEGTVNGVELSKSAKYNSSFSPENQENAIYSLMEKLVINIDKYVDSKLDIQ